MSRRRLNCGRWLSRVSRYLQESSLQSLDRCVYVMVCVHDFVHVCILFACSMVVMFVCVYVCVRILLLYVSICRSGVSVSCIRAYRSVCVPSFPRARVPACMYVCPCTRMAVCGSVYFSACVCAPAYCTCIYLCVYVFVCGGASSLVTMDSRTVFHSPAFTLPLNVLPLPGVRLHCHVVGAVVLSPWEVSCSRTTLTTSIPLCRSYSRAVV